MKIAVLNVSESTIKTGSIKLYENGNGTEININTDSFSYFSSGTNLVCMTKLSKRGFIHNKIELSEIFPGDIDLGKFCPGPTGQQVKTLDISYVDKVNSLIGYTAVNKETDVFKNSTETPGSLVGKYLLFCRLTGFYEIDVSDVILTEANGKMTINVVGSNMMYKGSLEVNL